MSANTKYIQGPSLLEVPCLLGGVSLSGRDPPASPLPHPRLPETEDLQPTLTAHHALHSFRNKSHPSTCIRGSPRWLSNLAHCHSICCHLPPPHFLCPGPATPPVCLGNAGILRLCSLTLRFLFSLSLPRETLHEYLKHHFPGDAFTNASNLNLLFLPLCSFILFSLG